MSHIGVKLMNLDFFNHCIFSVAKQKRTRGISNWVEVYKSLDKGAEMSLINLINWENRRFPISIGFDLFQSFSFCIVQKN